MRTPLRMAVPAVCALGLPILPVLLPGTSVSPGSKTSNLLTAAGFTVMAAHVADDFVPSVMSVAVHVHEPAVLFVTLKDLAPEAKAEFAGNTALPSLLVMPMVSIAVLTMFQLASTALTVRL